MYSNDETTWYTQKLAHINNGNDIHTHTSSMDVEVLFPNIVACRFLDIISDCQIKQRIKINEFKEVDKTNGSHSKY